MEILCRFTGRVVVLLFALFVIGLMSSNSVSCQSETVVYRGETLTIAAQLLQNGSFGDPVSYQDVEFFDETFDVYLGSVRTNWNGYASLEWRIPWSHPLGLTIFNVTYRGNDSLNLWPSFQQSSVIILSKTEMNVGSESDDISLGDSLVIDVQLIRDSGEYIVGEEVSVICDNIQIAKASTNTSGLVRFSVRCNNTWSFLGRNTVHVVYARNLTSYNEAATKTFEFVVSRIPTFLELYDSNQSMFHLNETMTVEVRSSAVSDVLTGVELYSLLDNEEFVCFQTNEYGIGTLSFLIDMSIEIGPHNLIVKYNGTERFESSLIEIQFIVVSEVLFDIVVSDLAVIDTAIHLEIRVYDYFHRNVTDFAVSLIDNIAERVMTVSAATGKNYVDFVYLVTAPKGPRTLMFVVENNPFVRNGTCMISLSVWTRPVITIVECSIDGYAYPGQTIDIRVLIRDSGHEYANRPIWFLVNNGSSSVAKITDNYGFSSLRIMLPMYECQYLIEIAYNGSMENYELSSNLKHFFTVSHRIPVDAALIRQSIVAPLREMQVSLLLIVMNGTPLKDSVVALGWLGIEKNHVTSQIGIIDVSLSMPELPGLYNLTYRIDESEFLSLSMGVIGISVSLSEVMSSQGAGLPVVASSLFISVALAAVPRIRRKYLIT